MAGSCGFAGPSVPAPDTDFTFVCSSCSRTVLRHEVRETRCPACSSTMHLRAKAIDDESRRLEKFLVESHSPQHRRDKLQRWKAHFVKAAEIDPDWRGLVRRVDEFLGRLERPGSLEAME